MDNYEWKDGYKSKFGLYTMSYKNGKRICELKDSGEYYREAIKNAIYAPLVGGLYIKSRFNCCSPSLC